MPSSSSLTPEEKEKYKKKDGPNAKTSGNGTLRAHALAVVDRTEFT